MTVLTTVLVLLLAVVVSSVVTRVLPLAIPTTIVQIAIGVALGLTVNLRVRLDPELFLLLFLPPLLFLDAWRLPKDELRRDLFTVIELALGLVLLTVAAVGLFVHWLIPAIPLAVAFALAAVVSPTDPVAVSSLTSRTATPPRMLRILEGEALLNDASGLVCLRFALAAMLTGTFSPVDASLTFAWLVTGGLVVGVAITVAATRAVAWIDAWFGEDTGSQILVTLLLPFASYLLAEQIHASGIIAAVAAGLALSAAERSSHGRPAMRVGRHSIWDMLRFTLNGAIFVLLGEQLTLVAAVSGRVAESSGVDSPWWLLGYIAAIGTALVIIRFGWIWVSLRFSNRLNPASHPFERPPFALVAAMSLAGVRGAVTLAGVLTIPFTLLDGIPFPGRGEAIFFATGVIVSTLLVATVLLPPILKRIDLPAEEGGNLQEAQVRRGMSRAALTTLERLSTGIEPVKVPIKLIEDYNLHLQLVERHAYQPSADIMQQERELRKIGIQAEREEVLRLARLGQVGDALARKLLRELDLAEIHHSP